MLGDGSENAIITAQAQLHRLTIDCERQLDEESFWRNECQFDEERERKSVLNNVIAKWRGLAEQVEELGEKVLILSQKSGDSPSETDSIMTDVNSLFSRLRDKYESSKRERDEIKSFLDQVDGDPDS
jgi:hypothetical protein